MNRDNLKILEDWIKEETRELRYYKIQWRACKKDNNSYGMRKNKYYMRMVSLKIRSYKLLQAILLKEQND